MVVLPILWTVSLAFQQVRLLTCAAAGFIGDYSLDNFTSVLASPGFLDALVNDAGLLRRAGPPARSGWGWWPRSRCGGRSAGAGWSGRAC